MTSKGSGAISVDLVCLFSFFYNASWRSHLPDWQGCNSSTEREWFEREGHRKESQKEWATSVAGLKKIARKVWRQVTPEYLNKLYESMLWRMQAVIRVQGGHTKY